ncbi:54c33c2c-b8c8-4175-9936-8b6750c1446d [Thermothielavioides terrestris]|uniref:54c33c2c-b8c8-4175-9936-8b6750c1446d n=1 Tax=Thermothielavioides terrestris TaxID=2587410 RepID=A0A3S4EZR8_9PEZI|nr:54c33c2c-b8c8-4175-9936-8b6750c1446d [Thermothielavioides terrestris]
MPLHLLGKKSWNVYNAANIARVRRDEAEAKAREEAEEQRMQEADAARRLAILRGELPLPPEQPEPEPASLPPHARAHDRGSGGGRKRKRHGEDDTDFEMRLARERAAISDRASHELAPNRSAGAGAAPPSLVDSRGHITLFSAPANAPHEKNEEAAREAARKERELKDQYQMRLANAAGRDGRGLTDGGPWYASADGDASAALVPTRDVWGREDPGRKGREAARLDASDPLAAMKRGARMVRD